MTDSIAMTAVVTTCPSSLEELEMISREFMVSPERLGTGGNSKSNRSVYWFFLGFLPRRGLESCTVSKINVPAVANPGYSGST
jgi:hypothetical protein